MGDCVRFNAVSNNSLETVNSTSQFLEFIISYSFRQTVSNFEYIDYSLKNKSIDIYVGDNSLNSYIDMIPLTFEMNNNKLYFFRENLSYISTVENYVQNKLGDSYNDCDESLNETYRHMNCIDECVNREIGQKYNCSIPNFYSE